MCFFKLFKRRKKAVAEPETAEQPAEEILPVEEVQHADAEVQAEAVPAPVETVADEPVAEAETVADNQFVEVEAEEATDSQPVEVEAEEVEDNQPVEVEAEEVTDSQPVEVATETVEDNQPAEAEEPAVPEQRAEESPAVVRKDNGRVLVKVKYNRSFTAKIIQADDKLKNYYGEIKNELLRYKVKSRTSWRYEAFKKGRKLIARISMRGKTLSLYLALDPKAYDGTKYKIDDVSSVANNAAVPALYKIKNDRRCKYSKDLISAVMAENGLEAGENPMEDYCAKYPYEELEPLIERKLVKLLKWEEKGAGAEEGLIEISEEQYGRITSESAYSEVAAAQDETAEEPAEEPVEEVVEEQIAEEPVYEPVEEPVEETVEEEQPVYPEIVESITVVEAEERIADEVVKTFIQESEKFSDKTKKVIVNIDTLGKYFNAGDTVNIEEIKKRVPSVTKKATYIKVLARGTLDKALNVEADDFSPSAVKMIVLTGGTVSRTKSRN